MKNLLHRNDKIDTVKKMVEYPTVNLNALFNSCAKIACCWSELIFTFLYPESSIQNVSEQLVSFIQLSFLNFAVHPTSQTRLNGLRFGDSKCSIILNNQK